MRSNSKNKCVVLFSGGTDSTCVAALSAQDFQEIHLLTFFELGTKNSPIPVENVSRLREKFPAVKFVHKVISTDLLVKKISYDRYWRNLLRHHFFVLATPGFSTLSWHVTALQYCLKEGISVVRDGQTRELMHFPGHMDCIIALFRDLYAKYDVLYENPVRQWAIPLDQQVIDRLIVGRHGFFPSSSGGFENPQKTTGEYLFSLGIFPHKNVKGSAFDKNMQHDCYPFILYNIFAFWYFLPFRSMKKFEQRMEHIFREKIARCNFWLTAKEIPEFAESAF